MTFSPPQLKCVNSVVHGWCSAYVILHDENQFILEPSDNLENVPLQHCYFSSPSRAIDYENFVNSVNTFYVGRCGTVGIVNRSSNPHLVAEVQYAYYLFEFLGDLIHAKEKLNDALIGQHFQKFILPTLIGLYGFQDDSDLD